ncbi:MAG: hypothetical protein QM714_09895 [Nocardioides sp.]|uniref:hypothetical protein n=1 Tax=Nocardioides sp. TaxID=35761 RepID=UPI0039E601A5
MEGLEMVSRAAACLAGFLGGLSWLLLLGLDRVKPSITDGDWGVALQWAGGVWLALAAATAAARLVRSGTVWLRAIVAVSAVLLAVIAWSLATGAVDRRLAEGVIGGVVAVVSAVVFRRSSSAKRWADAEADA